MRVCVFLLILMSLGKSAVGQEINVATGKVSNQTFEIYYVVGGESLGTIINNSFFIVSSSLPFNDNVITSLNEPLDDTEVYPNPFSNKLVIELPISQAVQMIDSRGVLINSGFLSAVEWDVSDLSSGLYFIRLINKGNSRTIKLIKHE